MKIHSNEYLSSKFFKAFFRYKNVTDHFFFALLCFYAFYFAQERLLVDSSFYLFKVVNNEAFWIENHRYVLLFSQILPLIAVKLELSLKAIIVIYSVGHMFFFYMIYLLCRYRFHFKAAGVLLILMLTLNLSSASFVPMAEIFYGSGLLVLLYAFLSEKEVISYKDLFIIGVLGFFILTSHSFTYFLYSFVFLALGIRKRFKKLSIYIFLAVLLLSIFFFKSITASDYDKGKMDSLFYNLQHYDYNLTYIKQFFIFLFEHYLKSLLLFFAVLIFLLLKKKYLLSIILFLTCVVLFILINLSLTDFYISRYQQQVYFPFTFLVIFSFAALVLPQLPKPIRITGYLVAYIFVGMSVIGIHRQGNNLSKRVAVMHDVIRYCQNIPGQKFYIDEQEVRRQSGLTPNWSYPIETLLLSSAYHMKPVTIATTVDLEYDHNQRNLTPSSFLFRRWDIVPINALNKAYFHLDEGIYKKINAKEAFSP